MTIVSDDDRPPYFRPALTKELVTGEQTRPTCRSRPTGGTRRATSPCASAARAFGFDHAEGCWPPTAARCRPTLVLATGSSAGSLPVPGADAPQSCASATPPTPSALLDAVGRGGDVLVIGSGFIGCEVAASLRRRGTP